MLKNKSISLFTQHQLGDLLLPNKIAMAALTRMRCNPKDGVPNEMHVKYYTERAEEAAFVLTECTAIEPLGNSFYGAPGIYSKEQIEGWKKVTSSVHSVKGRIFLQIWHCGRSGPEKIIGGIPKAPSNIRNRHKTRGIDGIVDLPEPKELSKEEIKELVDIFEQGAKNAKEAGFDGVELHGANGYLIDNFLRDGSNKRTDEYGGSAENRCRFPLEVIDRLIGIFGAERVGIKISPLGRLNDMYDSDPEKTYAYLLKELGKRFISFVEIMKAPDFRKVENLYEISGEDQIKNIFITMKKYFVYEKEDKVIYKPTLIGNNNLDLDQATELISENECDMISFGRLFISNPDLVTRLKNGYELTPPDYDTFYTPGEKGYITYEKYKIK